jgi:hypothetical protein
MSVLHEDTERALRMLGSAALPEGMEARVAARVRAAELNVVAAPGSIWRWSLVTVGALAIAGVVLLGRHHARDAAPLVVETRSQVMPMAPVVVEVEHVRRGRRVVHAAVGSAGMSGASQVAPPLPLTQQEKLLLAFAQRPGLAAGLGSVATSEVIVDHGLGENAIFELDHEEFAQLKSTLQLVPLKSALPQPVHSGDIE